MFTTPCFIRKNTPELRKKLDKLGYKILNSGNTTLDAHNFDGKGHHKLTKEGTAIITSYDKYYGIIYSIDNIVKNERIDCGTNEELFLAIAALRDDSDINQWFCDEIFAGSRRFALCEQNSWKEHFNHVTDGDCGSYKDWHKANVEELVKHFKLCHLL